MTAKEALEKIKMLFEEQNPEGTPAPSEPVEFVEAKTEDGQTIKANDWNTGTPVMVVTEEGELPIADGEHKLDNGSILITAGGLVVEVKEPKVEEPAAPVDEAMAAEVATLKDEVTAMKAANAEIKMELEKSKVEFSATQKNNKEAIAMLCDLIEKIAAEPIAEPKTTEVPNEKFARAEKKANAVDRWTNVINQVKTKN